MNDIEQASQRRFDAIVKKLFFVLQGHTREEIREAFERLIAMEFLPSNPLAEDSQHGLRPGALAPRPAPGPRTHVLPRPRRLARPGRAAERGRRQRQDR